LAPGAVGWGAGQKVLMPFITFQYLSKSCQTMGHYLQFTWEQFGMVCHFSWKLDVSMATLFCQACFSKLEFFFVFIRKI